IKARQEAYAFLIRDDGENLQKAIAQLDDAGKKDPKYYPAAADRGLALTLSAADLREETQKLEAKAKALDAQRAEVANAKAEGWERRQGELVDQMKAVAKELEPSQERARKLGDEALQSLKVLY